MFAQFGHTGHAVQFLQRAEALGEPDPELLHIAAAIRGENIPDRAAPEYMSILFDRHAESFDRNLCSLGYTGPDLISQALDRLGLKAASDLNVLDAGCGTGLCGPAVKRFARHLVGIDLSNEMLRLARDRRCYDGLRKLDVLDLGNIYPGKFDLVISADVLVYFGPLVDVLTSYRKCLRPGGHMIVTVEAAPDDIKPPGYELQPTGRFRHSAAYLRSAAEEAGLTVTEIEITGALRFEFEEPVEAVTLAGTVF